MAALLPLSLHARNALLGRVPGRQSDDRPADRDEEDEGGELEGD